MSNSIYKNTGCIIHNEYLVEYGKLISLAKDEESDRKLRKQKGEYFEKHHAFPQSYFGRENNIKQDYLAYLTAQEHYEAHYLLCKFTTSKLKTSMVYAFHMMSHDNQRRKIDKVKYEEIRKAHSKIVSKRMKNKIVSQQTGNRISKALKGKVTSKETRKKMSESRKGLKRSVKSCKNLSEAKKGAKNPNSKDCLVFGLFFGSARDGYEFWKSDLNIGYSAFKNRLHNIKYTDYEYV